MTADKHYYELCALSELRNHLRSGDISVPGSKQYQDFDGYLINKDTYEEMKRNNDLPVAIETDFNLYMTQRMSLLESELDKVNTLLQKGKLDVDEKNQLVQQPVSLTIDETQPSKLIISSESSISQGSPIVDFKSQLVCLRGTDNQCFTVSELPIARLRRGLKDDPDDPDDEGAGISDVEALGIAAGGGVAIAGTAAAIFYLATYLKARSMKIMQAHTQNIHLLFSSLTLQHHRSINLKSYRKVFSELL